MTHLEDIALHLATQHAMAAGDPEPWDWATAHLTDFLDQAAGPWAQQEYDREADAALAEYEAIGELANILLGPPPSASASPAEHTAYAERFLDALEGK